MRDVLATFALELEGQRRRTILPVGRTPSSERAVRGEDGFSVSVLAAEPGVRPRL